jgi:hypothetical protein
MKKAQTRASAPSDSESTTPVLRGWLRKVSADRNAPSRGPKSIFYCWRWTNRQHCEPVWQPAERCGTDSAGREVTRDIAAPAEPLAPKTGCFRTVLGSGQTRSDVWTRHRVCPSRVRPPFAAIWHKVCEKRSFGERRAALTPATIPLSGEGRYERRTDSHCCSHRTARDWCPLVWVVRKTDVAAWCLLYVIYLPYLNAGWAR